MGKNNYKGKVGGSTRRREQPDAVSDNDEAEEVGTQVLAGRGLQVALWEGVAPAMPPRAGALSIQGQCQMLAT